MKTWTFWHLHTTFINQTLHNSTFKRCEFLGQLSTTGLYFGKQQTKENDLVIQSLFISNNKKPPWIKHLIDLHLTRHVIKLRSDFPKYSYKVDFYKFDGTKYLSYINDNFVIF